MPPLHWAPEPEARRRTARQVAACLLAFLPAFLAVPLPAAEEAELLSTGAVRERSIAPGELHAWWVEGADAPLLVTVEQQGIDVVVTASGPGEPAITVDAPNVRWGPETLLLAAGAGGRRIEIRPGEPAAPPGRYVVKVEALSPAADGGSRLEAEAAMSRGGQGATGETAVGERQAVADYRTAAEIWRVLGERRRQAEAETAVAVLEQRLGELQAAVAGFRQAAALWQEVGEPRRETLARRQLGLAFADLGEPAAAREALQAALALATTLSDRSEEAEVRRSLCYLEQVKGDLPAALACYGDVRALFHDLGDRSQEEAILNNLGGLFDLQGEPDAALDHYRQALALRRARNDRRGEAQTLNNIAVIHRRLGEWQEALRLYDEARQILADLGDRPAAVLGNLGFAYFSLGQPQRALALWQEALTLQQQIGDRRGEALLWSYFGLASRRVGNGAAALAQYRRGLALATAAEDRRLEANIRLRLSELLVEQGAPLEALRELEPVFILLAGTGIRSSDAAALQLRGRALALAGQLAEALPVLREALARRRSLRDRAGEAETLYILAVAERAAGSGSAALADAEAAVALVEDLRRGFVIPGQRAAFLATERRAYTLLIDLLMADCRPREALAMSERSQARSLLDVLYQGGAARAGDAASADLFVQRRDLRRRLSLLAEEQQRRDERGEVARSAELGRKIELSFADLDAVEAEIRRRDPRFAAWSEPAAAPATPEAIAALLEPGTLLLEISLGEERSFAWLIGPGVERSVTLPAGRELAALARQTLEEMSTLEAGGRSRAAPAAADLSRRLLAPLWAELASAQRLVIVADTALQPVPFAALPVPAAGQSWDSASREPLLVAREVVSLPSAATLELVRRRRAGRAPAPRPALVMADPVFGPADPRWPAGTPADAADSSPADLPRLPATRREAEEIARLRPVGEVRTAFDFAASRETVLSGELSAYRILHFATHGRIDLQNPELSGLMLSFVDAAGHPRDGALRLHDLYDLDLAADLAVLSGCQTAFGGEVEGEGLMGLTRGFLYAGVPRVVASLWRADDRATAELMTRFYRALWREGASPAAALRQAQLALRQDPRYRAPYSWAGFIFQGDWRQE